MGFIQVRTELSCSYLSEGIRKNYQDIFSVAASGCRCWLCGLQQYPWLKGEGTFLCVWTIFLFIFLFVCLIDFPTEAPSFNWEVACFWLTQWRKFWIFSVEKSQPTLVAKKEAKALTGAPPLREMLSKCLLPVCCLCLSAPVLFPAASKTLKPFFPSCPSLECLSEKPRQCNEQDLCF